MSDTAKKKIIIHMVDGETVSHPEGTTVRESEGQIVILLDEGRGTGRETLIGAVAPGQWRRWESI